jgi:Rps23 Pro-64 3,4-dihydroxylase Tpa1-like proline 4-hydroxylase
MNGQKLTDLKSELFTNGFTSFNVKDLSVELYNELELAIPPNSLNPNQFNNLQMSIINPKGLDTPLYPNTISDTSFEELSNIKNDVLDKYNFKNGYSLDQIWFYKSVVSRKILDFRYKLYTLFYENYNGNCGTKITLYNDDCFLINHQDNHLGYRDCATLIYLSTDWDSTKGGELIIDNNHKVPPIYGNVAILDFTKFNAYHSVTPVKGFNRYCLLSFCHSDVTK